MRDYAVAFLITVLFFAGIAFAIWLRFAAPCGDLGWLPIGDLPGRCLTLVKP